MTAPEDSGHRRSLDVRVGDAERNEAAAALQQHFAEGRLTWDELDERLKTAYAARTRRELDALFDDLPAPPVAAERDRPVTAASAPSRLHDRAFVARAGSSLLVMAGVIAIVAGLHVGWVFFPLLVLWWRFAAGLPSPSRHAHGSSRPRFGNPYAPGGDRHAEVQRLRQQHRSRHHGCD